jgi:hypothetical protein
MISFYARIAGNYFKPLGFKVAYVVIATFLGLSAWYRLEHRNEIVEYYYPTPLLFFFVFLPTVWLADMGIIYLKEQLATWQSSLVPHYRRPHLIVGAAFVALALCVVPLLFNQFAHLQLFPLIALCTAAASIVGWVVYDPSIKTILVLFAALAALCFPQAQEGISRIVHGGSRSVTLALFGGSIAMFAWIWWQLARLREGMPQYRAVVPTGTQRAMTEVRGGFQAGALDRVAGWIARYPGSRIASRYLEPVDSFFARVAHRRVVTAGGWIPWRLGALWSLALLLMLVCINFAFDANHRMKFADLAPMVFIISMPAAPIITSSLWMRRASMLPYEMTLPSSRRSFVRETMIALVWDYFSCWLGAFIIGFALLIWTNFHEVTHGDPEDVLAGFVFFFSGQVAALAIIAWTLRSRSSLLSIFTMVVAAALSLPPLLLATRGALNGDALTQTIIIFIGGGLIVLFDAYRRWLRVDFE